MRIVHDLYGEVSVARAMRRSLNSHDLTSNRLDDIDRTLENVVDKLSTLIELLNRKSLITDDELDGEFLGYGFRIEDDIL
jgi:hypothetical protein